MQHRHRAGKRAKAAFTHTMEILQRGSPIIPDRSAAKAAKKPRQTEQSAPVSDSRSATEQTVSDASQPCRNRTSCSGCTCKHSTKQAAPDSCRCLEQSANSRNALFILCTTFAGLTGNKLLQTVNQCPAQSGMRLSDKPQQFRKTS